MGEFSGADGYEELWDASVKGHFKGSKSIEKDLVEIEQWKKRK